MKHMGHAMGEQKFIPPEKWRGRRYYAFSRFLMDTFGERIFKVAIDAGFTCPNRDGTVGTGGCAYCNPDSFAAKGRKPDLPIREQVKAGVAKMKKSYGAHKFLAYFQNYTNTYGGRDELRSMYLEALEHPDIVGLTVGTRPDCLEDDVLDLLSELNGRTHLWVELGLQSASDAVLEVINRGHTVDDFEKAALRLRERGINVCAHVIIGLPGDGLDSYAECARLLSRCGVNGVKIHQFQIVAGSRFGEMYEHGELVCPDLPSFLEATAFFLERLSPEMSIHRLFGIGNNGLVLAPDWSYRRVELAKIVEDYLEEQDVLQGRRFYSA